MAANESGIYQVTKLTDRRALEQLAWERAPGNERFNLGGSKCLLVRGEHTRVLPLCEISDADLRLLVWRSGCMPAVRVA